MEYKDNLVLIFFLKISTCTTRQSSWGKPQEAYHLRHNCPSVTYRGGVHHPGQGVPHPVLAGGYPILNPDLAVGVPHHALVTPFDCVPLHLGLGYPPSGTGVPPPPQRDGTCGSIMGWRWNTSPGKDMEPMEVLWDGDRVTPNRHMLGKK